MKKQLLFLFFALLALCASAEPNDVFSVGDLTYSVILDSYSGKPGIVSVKSLSAQGKAKTSLKLDIPGVVYYNGYKYKVGVIARDAFKGQSNISVVQIRYNITRIWQSAFENCTSLTTVYMPSSLTNVGYRAFGGCTALRSVYYANATPSSTSVEPGSFPWNSGMTLYVSKVHPNSKENARKVTAFDYFSTIKKHEYACDFIFGDHGYFCVTKAPLSDGTTRGEMSLVGVYADDNFNNSWSGTYNNGIADFDVVAIADSACLGDTGIKNVNLTGYSKLRRIGESAFNGCTALSSVTLGQSVLEINDYAFKNCSALTTFNVTNNVSDFAPEAVDGCSNLATITVSSLNTHYCDVNGILYSKDKTVLKRCPPGYRTTIFNHSAFPSTLKRVDVYAFQTCEKVEKIYFPYGVKDIFNPFQGCKSLTTLQFPSTVTNFNYIPWGDLSKLTTVYLNNQTPPWGMHVGSNSSAPRHTLYVPDEAIEAYKKATYWSTWKYIKGGAYDVTTNDAMETLRYTIHSDKTETINGNSYAGRAMLVYAPDPTVYSPTYAVPDHLTLANGKKYAVTAINSNVCSGGMRTSATLKLGANVDSIFSNAFRGKTMLIGLKLNSNLTYIGVNAFYDCRIANDLALPYGFKKLSSGAFYNNSFKRFLIPGSLISMANTCLARNNYLEELIINDPYWARFTSWDLTKIPTSCKLYVPVGSVEAYKNNEKWGKLKVMAGSYDFTYNNADPNKTIYHMTVTSGTPLTVDGVTYAGKAKYVYHPANMTLESPTAFDCTNSEIDMTNGGSKKYLMTEFGDSALIWCEQLTNVRVDRMEHLERIGNRAFCGTKITQFTVPASCSHIGNMAFSACSKLSELMLMRNQNRTYGRLFYQLNATNFNCYINWKDHYNLYLDVSKWPTSPYRPECKDQLNGWVQINDGSTVSTFVVYHPVDWEASGLNAYIVDGYDKNKKIASTMKMGRTSTANGVLIEGYKQNVIYKLKRPITEPTNPKNLLLGATDGANLDKFQVAYVFDKKDKYFWKPSSGYRAEAGSAFLRLTSTQAGNTTKVYIDRWSNATGDINGDGEVNVSDVTALINKILGSSTYSDAVCDINGDGEINVSDVTALINLILK